MIEYLRINETDNQVEGYSKKPEEGHIPYEFENSMVTVNDLLEGKKDYALIDDQLRESNTRILKLELEELKRQRMTLFKTYIDRSPMFYSSLSLDQHQELETWYQTWKDMPTEFEAGTWVEPALPLWLK